MGLRDHTPGTPTFKRGGEGRARSPSRGRRDLEEWGVPECQGTKHYREGGLAGRLNYPGDEEAEPRGAVAASEQEVRSTSDSSKKRPEAEG